MTAAIDRGTSGWRAIAAETANGVIDSPQEATA